MTVVVKNDFDYFIKYSSSKGQHNLESLGDIAKASIESLDGSCKVIKVLTSVAKVFEDPEGEKLLGYMYQRIMPIVSFGAFSYTLTGTYSLIKDVRDFKDATVHKVINISHKFFEVLSCLPYFLAFIARNPLVYIQWTGTSWLSLVNDVSDLAANISRYFDVKYTFINPELLSDELKTAIYNENTLIYLKTAKSIVSIVINVFAFVTVPTLLGGVSVFGVVVVLGAIKASSSLGIDYYKKYWLISYLKDDIHTHLQPAPVAHEPNQAVLA